MIEAKITPDCSRTSSRKVCLSSPMPSKPEEITCAFYLFKLPEAWRPYFAVGLSIRPCDLIGPAAAILRAKLNAKGIPEDTPGYLYLHVLHMGWFSAVGIMQAIHRNLLGTRLAGGAHLPEYAEVRKTAVMPTSDSQRFLAAWQVYLDNFAS